MSVFDKEKKSKKNFPLLQGISRLLAKKIGPLKAVDKAEKMPKGCPRQMDRRWAVFVIPPLHSVTS